jgi:CelD/BcsL family acetyltransferase involved in cellulose biosynthesis
MARVIEIDSLDKLQPYRLWWSRLFQQTSHASFFQTFDWLEVYWRHFGRHQQLKVLVTLAAGQPIGIVPLVVRPVGHRVTTLDTLSYPLDDWGTSYGPIGPNLTASLTLAMRHLSSGAREWDEIALRGVAHDAYDRRRTERAMALGGLPCTVSPYQTSSIVDTAGSWESYLASRPRKVRHEIARHVRRAEQLEGFEFVRHRPEAACRGDGDPAWHLYDQCEQVAAASWQASSTAGNTLSHPDYRDYYRDAHATAARLGMVDISLLRLHGRPVAFVYGYHYQGRVFGLRMGYDAEHAPDGAGTELLLLALRDSFARGDTSFELGPGDQSFKQRLRTRNFTSWQLSHVPERAWKSQVVRAAQWLGAQGRQLARSGRG